MMQRRTRGFALPLVLWLMSLVIVAAGLLAYAASTRHLQAHGMQQRVEAEAAAEAGIAYATARLDKRLEARAWNADGKPKTWRLGHFKVVITIRDEAGKLDINTGDTQLLRALLTLVGIDDAQADLLVRGIEAPRRERMMPQNGMTNTASGRMSLPFRTISTLTQLPGVQPETVAKIGPQLTVYSGRALPDIAVADAIMRHAMQISGRAMGTPVGDGTGSGLYDIEAIAAREGQPSGRVRVVLRWSLRSDGSVDSQWLEYEHGHWQYP